MPESKKNVRAWPVLRAYSIASAAYPWALTLSILGTIGIQVAAVTAPLYLKQFINVISANNVSHESVVALFGILFVYALIGAGAWIMRSIQVMAIQHIEAHAMADLANQAFSNLIRHGHDFFISNFTGTLTRRVTRYSRAYEQVFDSFIFNFFQTFLFAAGSIYILYTRNVWLGTGLLAWVILYITAQVYLTMRNHALRAERVAEDSRMTGALSDAIGNHATVTFFGSERYEESLLSSIVKSWETITLRSWHSSSTLYRTQQALSLVIEIGLMGGAVLLWQRGLLTVGDFVLIQIYVLGLINQIRNIGDSLRRLYDAIADASEMIDIMETPNATQDIEGSTNLKITAGEINLTDVSFSYNEHAQVLDHFSLRIEGGKKVAFVGSSGAGKSTITKLLLRLYDPTSGTITIDGQDIRTVTQESLRTMISFVPQESILFHRTLRDNIRYGKQDATEEEIMEAAKSAHCHEFISKLPDGYDTFVGERGVKLSGGERQRVAIARAILKNAPILILDEATSSLDSESEALIQDALAKLMEGKTVIAIAHRLSTVMKMDRIIVMENGAITLSGTHDELLAHDSNLYKKLWEIQAGGFMSSDK